MMNKYIWGILALWLFGAACVMLYDASVRQQCLETNSIATCYEAMN